MGELASIISAVLAAIALIGTFLAWRVRELRKEEVLGWSLECIENLQSLLIICIEEDSSREDEIRDLKFRASILCEQGRMYFKNARPDDFGSNKEAAYRGYRPRILDYMVIGYQIAEYLPRASEAEFATLKIVAENNLKKFVSLVQKEVGRSRTASADTSQGGSGIHLQSLMRYAQQGITP